MIRSNPTHEDKNEKDHKDEPEATGRIVTPTGAVGPRRKRADEKQDQDNQ